MQQSSKDTHTAPLFDKTVQRDAWRTHPPWLVNWNLNIIRIAGCDARAAW